MQCKIWRGKGEGRKTTETEGVLWKMHKSGEFPSARIDYSESFCSPAGSLILAPCDNLTAKNHYSRVYNFVWGLECHGPVRIDGRCFSFGKVTYVVVTMAVDTNLFKAMHFFNISLFSRLLFSLPHFVPSVFLLR